MSDRIIMEASWFGASWWATLMLGSSATPDCIPHGFWKLVLYT